MGKPFKIILSSIAATVLLLIAAIAILPFVINLNNFKPEIAAAVKDKIGRELVLDGQIKLSLFPWVGISTGKITLNNAADFQGQPFATIEESDVKILLLPLLAKKIHISHIVLKGLVLNLAKSQQGITNWNDLLVSDQTKSATVPAEPTTQATAAEAAFAIDSIAIEHAKISWDDLKNEKHLSIQNVNVNADKFTFDEPVGIAASFTALDSQSKTTLAIKLNTELSVNDQLDTFALRHNELQLTASNESVPISITVADIALDTTKQTAKIFGLLLKSSDVALSADLTGSSIKDNPSFHGPVAIAPFNPTSLMQQLSITKPAMQDDEALSKLAVNVDLTATSDSVDLQNLVMTLDDSQIKGSLAIKDFALPVINFDVDIDALDLGHYLPPADKASKPIASPAVLLAVSLLALPDDMLKKLNAEGSMSLGKLKINGLTMQNTRINVTAKKGVFTTQQSIKQFYQGSYIGNLNLDKQGDKSALLVKEKIDHVQIEPLLKDYQGKAWISGIVDASAQLQAQGNSAEQLKATLGGQLSFMFADSAIKGFNLQKVLDEGKALFKGSALSEDYKNEQTLFSAMSGTATITNGLIHNNDLVASSSKLRVDGQGSLNLNTEALDYKIDAKLLGDITAPAQDNAAVTLNITGTLSKPTYTIDLASLLSDKNKAKIDKLINKIDNKLGPGIGNLLKNFIK